MADPNRQPRSPSSNKGGRHRPKAGDRHQAPKTDRKVGPTPPAPLKPPKPSNPDPQPQLPVPPPHQQDALLEGESSCNEMVPGHQFRRPLSPPMQRKPLQGQGPAHAPAQNPGNTPARTQAPQAQPGPQPGPQPEGDMPQEPRAHPRPAEE
ncbi:hypothetical protein ILYODFUR_037064 [Ilyodon furcidens]|uniref:Uncharacterized protein n=1 Tax=Ilyodon furcidens TaxID=33524 RepID=A0ABV0VKF5_9TELE